MTTILVLVIISALIFDFANGWNDSANAIATVISTRVLPPLVAVAFAAILNFAGALVSTEVAKTIGGGLVAKELVTSNIILASMLSASSWVIVCTLWGLPISGSHSLIGALVGAAAAGSGIDVINVGGVVKVFIALIASPLLGFIGGYILLVVVYWIALKMRPGMVRKVFGGLQICSSGFMAFTHGMNDAQKVMGVITLALFSAKQIDDITVPMWVMMACATVMGMGTIIGGWKVIKTLGMRLAHIRPIEGFAAETAAGGVLTFAAGMGVPVSTTHTITGSIIGVGAAYHAKSVKWSVGKKILYAWVFTLPVTAILGAALTILFDAIL